MENPLFLKRRSVTLGGVAAALSLYSNGVKAISGWPNGARAAVSLTYDDGYESQLGNVAPLLDELGLKATFFLTINNITTRLNDWVAVANRGHEIGDHTMSHPCKLANYSSARFLEEQIEPAERYLDVHFGGPKRRCFAYPCGFEGLGRGNTDLKVRRYQEVLRPTFLAARTVDGDPNNPRIAVRQRYFLSGFEPTYDMDDPRGAFDYVRLAINRGHWAILVFHEVLAARRGEGDTSKAVHRMILERLLQKDIWCAPMGTVFHHLTNT